MCDDNWRSIGDLAVEVMRAAELRMREAGEALGHAPPRPSHATGGGRPTPRRELNVSATDRGTVWGHGVASPGQPQVLPTNRVNASRCMTAAPPPIATSPRRLAAVIHLVVVVGGPDHSTLANSP